MGNEQKNRQSVKKNGLPMPCKQVNTETTQACACRCIPALAPCSFQKQG